ncbi:MAG TPA: hypothetical protein VKV05_12705 [Terriglobales bacterium]|nr:hypothetical protein [Terriglobales bacterium]
MKTKALCVIGLYLCSMTVLAVAKEHSWEGWISDSKCGVKGANASHLACAKKCIQGGATPVLVTDKDQKVVAIANPDKVMDHLAQHVRLTGSMTSDGAIQVQSVKMLSSQKGGSGGDMSDMH